MKKGFIFSILLLSCFLLSSCASIPKAGSRVLTIDGVSVDESVFDVEVWGVFDRYNDELYMNILFQLEIIDASKNAGCVLYDDGIEGQVAFYSRDGVNRRWDWGKVTHDDGIEGCRYCFIIEPDGTGLYYDFGISSTAKPRSLYNTRKIK